MTWVAPNQQPVSFQEGLLKYLQSPMAHGISAGLLAAAAPSLTPQSIGGGLAQGLLYGKKFMDEDRKIKIHENTLAETIRHHKALEEMQRLTADLKRAKLENDARATQMILEDIDRRVAIGEIQPEEAEMAIVESERPQFSPMPPGNIPPTLNEIFRGTPTGFPMSPVIEPPPEPPQLAPQEKPRTRDVPRTDSLRPEMAKRAKLLLMGVKKEVVDALYPDDSQNLTGPAQLYASYEALEKKHGKDHWLVKQTKRALDAQLAATEQLTKTREKYFETADKRASTPLGRMQLELDDIMSGYLPGTNRTVELTPEQQQVLANQYELKMQKDVSDQDTRKRALFASNIDKTIKQIDVDSLVQYAGAMGTIKKKLEEGKALTGNETEEYAKYLESLTAVETLATQVRQFYGESITPSAKEALEKIVNPATWKNNPRLAKRQFEKLVDILENETSTFRGALTGTSEFKQQPRSASENSIDNDPLGLRKK